MRTLADLRKSLKAKNGDYLNHHHFSMMHPHSAKHIRTVRGHGSSADIFKVRTHEVKLTTKEDLRDPERDNYSVHVNGKLVMKTHGVGQHGLRAAADEVDDVVGKLK